MKLWPLKAALGTLGAFFLAAVAGGLTALAVRYLQTSAPAKAGFAISISLAVLLFLGLIVFRSGPKDWFHPMGFPVVYVGLALFTPIVFLLGLGAGIANIEPADVSLLLVSIFALTLVGFALGARVGMAVTRPKKADEGSVIDYQRVRRIGRVLLLAVVVLRVSRLPGSLASPYGAGFVTYDPETFLKTVEDGLVLISVMVITVANAKLQRSVFSRLDLALFGLFVAASLLSGSRGELVGPALFALWAHHTFIRRIGFVKGLAIALSVVSVFTLVFIYRSGREIQFGEADSLVGQGLSGVSTPIYITSEVVARVPDHRDFSYGSTYVAAVKRQLPGPVSRMIWGDPHDTGTYVFRDLIGFQSPNAGYAFALPSEAYLNFGIPGTGIIPFLAGMFFGFAYRRQSPRPSRPIHLLYPVLVATLPLSLRSDALVQIKGVLYPMVLAWVIFRVARVRLTRFPARTLGRPPIAVADSL